MEHNFKFGVSYAEQRPLTAPLPLCGDVCDAFRYAKDIGLDGIEIHGREYEFTDEQVERIKVCCGELGMKVAAVVTGRVYTQTGLSLADPVSERRTWVVDQVKRYIDVAASLKTDVVIGWVKGRFSSDNPQSLYYRLLTESMKELDAYAGMKCIRLVVEVINRYEVDCFITARETLDYIEGNGLEHTYLHLDTFHMNLEETDMYEAIRLAGPRLGYMHVADNTRLAPGTGCLDFKKIFETLKEIGYEGFITAECFPKPDGKAAAKAAAEYLKKIVSL